MIKPGDFIPNMNLTLRQAHEKGYYLCGSCINDTPFDQRSAFKTYRVLDYEDKTELVLCTLAEHTIYKPSGTYNNPSIPQWDRLSC